ncbi:lipopolysaccharide biosynthesis protein [Microvirga sp. STR05]|uniref:Lipopolysaccharide biosynthesis protein n=1 Tax=Hymenobacter duratus TaxID=2771356 RepID=A0ABR8JEN0_9BACT|nr:lipopolysaccharide biosynthesis protein [Hymenobacter duratus]MBD2715312.1 lipopolysaccharide biosynthesis protein [Hymenobacter duratus]MBR7950219.1 lipopolysaccharide biosynthesis protein [Microvirga sp. STR05]
MSASASSIPASTIRGLRWSMITTVAIAGLQFVYSGIMSRLLTPADFGLMGMAMVVISFGSYFAHMGLEQALIQRSDLQPVHIRATSTVAIGLGIVVTGLMWALAPLATLLFKEPGVVHVLRGMSLTFLLNSLGATSQSLLRRRMAFDLLARIEFGAFLAGYGVIGLGMAWAGWGIWSLVGATLANLLVKAVAAWLCVRHSLRPPLRWAHYQPLVNFGGAVSVVSLLEYFGSNLDRLSIGRLLGTFTLGLYNRTFFLVQLPLYHFTDSISRVMLPSYSSLQHDIPRLRPLYLTTLSLSAWVMLPMAAGMAVAAEPLVRVVLGPQWGAAVPLLGPLALMVGAHLLTIYSGSLCESLGRLRFKVWLQVGFIAGLSAGLWLAAPYGLRAMVFTVLLAEVLRHLTYQVAIHRYLQIPAAGLWGAYWPALCTALVLALVLGTAQNGLARLEAGALLQLLVLMVLGAVALLGQLAMPWNRTVRISLYNELEGHLKPGTMRNRLLALLGPAPAILQPS